MTEPKSTNPKRRLLALDVLRGLVIALMALDHSRDFFGDLRLPVDTPEVTGFGLYFTRWITHFCAPTFVFLAGVSAWLYGQRVDNKGLSWFLFTRGIWLLVLDHTAIYFALALSFGVLPWMFIVLSAIGVSMICLSAICRLPSAVVLVGGLTIMLLHNLLDPINLGQDNWLSAAWLLIHGGPGFIPWANLEVGYPVLPWLGIMMCGFGLGPITQAENASRQWIALGVILLAVFFVGRSINRYGDPRPWEIIAANPSVLDETQGEDSADSPVSWSEASYARTALSFLRTQKYPPSLLFTCMTLGPMLILLGLIWKLDELPRSFWPFWIFGRVPLFFYVVHFYLLHLGAILTYGLVRGTFLSPFQAVYSSEMNPAYGFSGLWQVYLAWGCLLLIMTPLCWKYGELKKNSDFWLLKYL